jgi:RND family efflux transporter MFP subunit
MASEDLSKLKIDKSQITTTSIKSRKRFYIIIAMTIVIILAVLFVLGIFTSAVKVDVATVTQSFPSQAFTMLNASGYVVPQRKAAVASKITGRIISLYVEEGSVVKKDAMIARLENDDVTATKDQAQANLNVTLANLEQANAEFKDAQSAFQRERNLFVQEFTTKASYDAAEARYSKAKAAVTGAEASIKASKAALNGANVALEYTFIRAPFDAVVLTKNADIGDIVTPIGAATNAKASVVTIADMGSLQVEADVSESNLEKVRIGQPCEIQLDALPEIRFRGVVHMIVPTADRSKATVMVKVRFIDKDGRILPEMSAKVAFLSREMQKEEEKFKAVLSRKAIIERNGKKIVFLLKGNRVVEAPVTTGVLLNDMIELKDGLKVGDRIVISPPDSLKNGSRVKLAQQ